MFPGKRYAHLHSISIAFIDITVSPAIR